MVKDTLTDLWVSCIAQNNFQNTLCEISSGRGPPGMCPTCFLMTSSLLSEFFRSAPRKAEVFISQNVFIKLFCKTFCSRFRLAKRLWQNDFTDTSC